MSIYLIYLLTEIQMLNYTNILYLGRKKLLNHLQKIFPRLSSSRNFSSHTNLSPLKRSQIVYKSLTLII